MDQFLAGRSRPFLAVVSVLLVGMVGSLDYLTGYELSFSVVYLIPVALASWYLGLRFGIVICLLSTLVWLANDYSTGYRYSHASIPYWNAGVRISFFIITTVLLVRLREALNTLASQAELDGLTGLLNYRTFLMRCNAVARLASRYNHSMALCFIDIDGFKTLNDSRGHEEGDRLLKVVANELKERVRESDLVGRMGGDEFVVLLPETDLAGARTFFPGLRASLLDRVAEHAWPVSFSMGVAVFRTPPDDIETAVRYADQLMYKVKHSGKNYILFQEFNGSS